MKGLVRSNQKLKINRDYSESDGDSDAVEYTEEGSSPFELSDESDIEDISGEKVQLDGFNIMDFIFIRLPG